MLIGQKLFDLLSEHIEFKSTKIDGGHKIIIDKINKKVLPGEKLPDVYETPDFTEESIKLIVKELNGKTIR
jgi:hypothetical protein